ncbi:hypothetical protein CRG98_033293 [Punica granatum]|uniref:Uncharacterized protein n=1 Tax=Punica granatum TaxID=22663 RepID=A0A2I0IQP7_PUNGR|nr:hypothetical protein CRG98_033293 [Punica granatum]
MGTLVRRALLARLRSDPAFFLNGSARSTSSSRDFLFRTVPTYYPHLIEQPPILRSPKRPNLLSDLHRCDAPVSPPVQVRKIGLRPAADACPQLSVPAPPENAGEAGYKRTI